MVNASSSFASVCCSSASVVWSGSVLVLLGSAEVSPSVIFSPSMFLFRVKFCRLV